MFRLIIQGDEATLRCPFCGEDNEWPYAASVLPVGDHPEKEDTGVSLAITSHLLGDEHLEPLGFKRCPQAHKWKSTRWQREIDGRTVSKGDVTMEGNSPRVSVVS